MQRLLKQIREFESLIRSHLNYYVIYEQPNSESFCSKIEQIQYNAALAITGAIRGTSQTKLYNELGPWILKFRRWFRWLYNSFKIKIHGKPEYVLNKILSSQIHCNARNTDKVETFYYRADIFKNSFFSLHNNWVEKTWSWCL